MDEAVNGMIIQLGESSDHMSMDEEFWSLTQGEWTEENLQHQEYCFASNPLLSRWYNIWVILAVGSV